MVRETRAVLLELLDELGRNLAHALHVAAIAAVQDSARNASGPTFQPSATISGRLRSIVSVTSNSSSRIGAAPFSFASSRPSCQPAIASSRETSSVNLIDSGEP